MMFSSFLTTKKAPFDRKVLEKEDAKKRYHFRLIRVS